MIRAPIRNEIRPFPCDNLAKRGELAGPASLLSDRAFAACVRRSVCQTCLQFARNTGTLIRAKALLECPDRAMP